MKAVTLFVLALATATSAEKELPSFVPTKITAPFLEQFDSPSWDQRWVASKATKTTDNAKADDKEQELRYIGKFEVEEPSEWPGIKGDKGLVLKTKSAFHAISAKFDKPLDPKEKTLVVQYEVKSQAEHECGGAYVKLLTADPSFKPAEFEAATPYTIMFGPDKCGYDNKVHFIFRHKNPLNGTIEEKHLVPQPQGKFSKKSALYTLVVEPDNSFEVFVNQESVKKGSLLKDFTPAVNPPKEIDDPTDSKPDDWVDDAKIPDPTATKPDDWDEEAPREIEDVDAKKPADWLDDEPQYVADPEATKPEDWDDDEDGDWTAPQVPNPKCAAASGCGEWTRPRKANPAYKGKWKAPLIDNPAYKGVWAPRKIPNPDYYEDAHPSYFTPIGAIGFELWSVHNDVLFDNIYVGHSVADAKALAKESWEVKYKKETEYEEEKKEEEKKEEVKTEADASKKNELLDTVQLYIDNFLRQFNRFYAKAQKKPLDAVKEFPHVVGVLVSGFLLLLTPFFLLLSGTSKPASPVKAKKAKKVETEDEKSEKSGSEALEDSPKKTVRARKTKKEDN